MWKLEQLQEKEVPQAYINRKWVPVRPENFKKRYCPLWKRIKYACEVITGKAETFYWPENQ